MTTASYEREMPLLGHLLMHVRGFALSGAIELQDRVDTDFPDSLGEGGLLCADGEFRWYSRLRSSPSMAMCAPLVRGRRNRLVSRRPRIDATPCATPKIRHRSSRTSW